VEDKFMTIFTTFANCGIISGRNVEVGKECMRISVKKPLRRRLFWK